MSSTLLFAMLMLGGAHTGMAKLSCDYSKIQPLDCLDLPRMNGTHYVAYTDHSTEIFQSGVKSFFKLDTLSKPGFVVYEFDHIRMGRGKCRILTGVNNVSDDGVVWTTQMFGNTEVATFLATDYNTTAVLVEFFDEQGVRDDSLSSIFVMVKDPYTEPDMDVLKEAMTYTCGSRAADFRAYNKIMKKPDATCKD